MEHFKGMKADSTIQPFEFLGENGFDNVELIARNRQYSSFIFVILRSRNWYIKLIFDFFYKNELS